VVAASNAAATTTNMSVFVIVLLLRAVRTDATEECLQDPYGLLNRG
jgi:hypothetical protein